MNDPLALRVMPLTFYIVFPSSVLGSKNVEVGRVKLCVERNFKKI